MPVINSDIIKIIDDFAPQTLAEEWDNSGWQLGDPRAKVDKVLLTLDVNAQLLEEAVQEGVQLIISHHPLFFKGFKNIRLDRPEGRLIAGLIKNDIAVYAAHTNLDSAAEGVNHVLAEKLGITEVKTLNPGVPEKLYKLVVFVPVSHIDQVRDAAAGAGAGWIGNYSDCTFQVQGTGTFRPLAGTNPFIGRQGELEKVEEIRLETVVPERLKNNVLTAILKAHPYEEVAYDLYTLANPVSAPGLGRIGKLNTGTSLGELAGRVKSVLNINTVRVGGPTEQPVHKVAVCGGAGASLWKQALSKGADVYITGDIKYHEAQDMLAAGLNFIDAGHFSTEYIILPALYEHLIKVCSEKGFNLEIILSKNQKDVFVYL